MKNNRPLIKLFAVNGTFYMYDAVPNKLISISSQDLYATLHKIMALGCEYIDLIEDSSVKNQILKLFRQGFLHNPICDIEHPYTKYSEFILERSVETLTLEITQNCNFKCRYCSFANQNAERSHSASHMSKEIIQKAIDLYKQSSIDFPSVSISFYGGEPLLAFSQIKYAMEYAEKSFFSKPIKYYMTTNAALLSGEVVDFLVNKNVDLLISYDGPQEVQDKNRRFLANGKSTFDIVKKNLEYIEYNHPEFFANNIMINSVLLNKSDRAKAEEFFDSFNLPKGCIRINMANTEHIEFINEGVESPLIEDDRDQKDFESILNKESVVTDICHHSGPCVPGGKKLFVTTNGDLYPCEKVNTSNPAYIIGSVFAGFDKDKVNTLLNIGQISKERCTNCWAINFCSMCCAQCDGINNLDDTIKKQRCAILKKNVLSFLKQYASTSL